MKRQASKLLLMLLIGAAPLGVSLTMAQGNGEECRLLSGTMSAASVPQFEGEALTGFDVTVTSATGPLESLAVEAALTVEQFLSDGSLIFTGEHRFGDEGDGGFVTADRGLTTGEGGVANTLMIIKGGSGFLVTTGNIDLESGILDLQYEGVHCAA